MRSAAWAERALEAGVAAAGSDEVVVRIEGRTEGAQGMVATEHLVVYFRGKDLPEPLVRAVERAAPARLAGWTLERLADAVAEDPDLGAASEPVPVGVDERERPRSLLDTWGGRAAYADFFAGGELARCQLDSLDPSRLFSFVQHSDSECVHVSPHAPARLVGLVSLPWERRAGASRAVHAGRFLESAATDELITTELDERDVILGNPAKLDQALAHALARQPEHGRTVFVSNTCVPVVTGEDVESRVRSAQAASGAPLLYLTVTPGSMVNVFHEMLVDRRLAAERAAAEPGPRRVNLVGFAKGPDLEELVALLRAVGVEVGAVVLPDLAPELVDALPRAGVSVYRPNALWQHLYDQLRAGSRIRAHSPGAPYGLAATRRWIGEVARAAGVEADLDALWQEAVRPVLARWDALRDRAGRFRLGLVVRAEETHYLTTPASTWGIPLVAALEEMGFGLDVLVHVEDREAAYRAAAEVQATFSAPERHQIKVFKTLEMMLRLLGESPARAVLTSHTYDWRVTGSGKVPFSLQPFEMGVAGAVRTAERLLAICETPFYARYGRYLRRTRSGLRPAGGGRDRG